MWYWGSFTQQRGFELSLGNGYLETTYRLALREYSDGLVRRPAADWSAAKLRSEVMNATCHLYGLEEVDGKEISDEYAEVGSVSSLFFGFLKYIERIASFFNSRWSSKTITFLKLIISLVIQVSSIDLEPTKYYLLAAARQVVLVDFALIAERSVYSSILTLVKHGKVGKAPYVCIVQR